MPQIIMKHFSELPDNVPAEELPNWRYSIGTQYNLSNEQWVITKTVGDTVELYVMPQLISISMTTIANMSAADVKRSLRLFLGFAE